MTEMTWTKVATLSQIPDDEGLEVQVEGREIAVFKEGEKVFCLENSCPHRGAALAEGRIQEGEVICPWHGWRFSLENGTCSSLPSAEAVGCFATRVENGEVFAQIPAQKQ